MTDWAPTPNQAAVLQQALEIGPKRSISTICRAAKVSRETFYRWMRDDAGFKAAWENLWREAISRHLPGIIASQISLAHLHKRGSTSAARLIVEMAGLIKQQIEHSGSNGGPILIEQVDREQAEREAAEWRQKEIEKLNGLSAVLTQPISPTSTG